MSVPEVHYARSGDVAIAYQVVGDGPMDVVFVRGTLADLLAAWDQPMFVEHVEGLASFPRVILFDKRGSGLSDPVNELPTLENRMEDVRAVLDALGCEQATLWSAHEGTRLAVLFAATYPERMNALVLYDPSARGLWAPDYPWSPTVEEREADLREIAERWGEREYLVERGRGYCPTRVDDERFLDWYVWYMRRSASPAEAVAFHRWPWTVTCATFFPPFALPRSFSTGPLRGTKRATSHHESRARRWWRFPASSTATAGSMSARTPSCWRRRAGSSAASAGHRSSTACSLPCSSPTSSAPPRRRVSSAIVSGADCSNVIMRSYVACSTGIAAARWRPRATASWRRSTAPRGPSERRSRPPRELRALGLEIRAGVHTGEVEVVGNDVAGIAVHTGARVAALAGPSEVLVSSTVKDLVAGSGIEFEERGQHELKGVPGTWRLYAVRDA